MKQRSFAMSREGFATVDFAQDHGLPGSFPDTELSEDLGQDVFACDGARQHTKCVRGAVEVDDDHLFVEAGIDRFERGVQGGIAFGHCRALSLVDERAFRRRVSIANELVQARKELIDPMI